jgi:hypothetical protein
MCYKPLYRSRKVKDLSKNSFFIYFLKIQSRNSSSIRQTQSQAPPAVPPTATATAQVRRPQTNYNYIINHNNIATPTSIPDFSNVFPGPNPALFNPMAASMMMFMMQQHLMSTMMAAAGLPQLPSTPIPPAPTTSPSVPSTTPKKTNVDRITRFWL